MLRNKSPERVRKRSRQKQGKAKPPRPHCFSARSVPRPFRRSSSISDRRASNVGGSTGAKSIGALTSKNSIKRTAEMRDSSGIGTTPPGEEADLLFISVNIDHGSRIDAEMRSRKPIAS